MTFFGSIAASPSFVKLRDPNDPDAVIMNKSGFLFSCAHFIQFRASIFVEAESAKKSGVGEESLVAEKADIELVESAIRGDGDSFTELCRRYYPAMVAIAHSILGDRHLAEDAAQQAFATAAFKLGQLKSKDKFASWLAAVCRNTANDMAGATERLFTTEELSVIPAQSKDDSNIEAVVAAIAALEPKAKEVIFLRYYDGMSYETISQVLGISQQAINGRLRRAKRKLANLLKGQGFLEA